MRMTLIICLVLTLCTSIYSDKHVFKKISKKTFLKLAKKMSGSNNVSLYSFDNKRFAYFETEPRSGFVLITGEFAAVGGFEGPTSVAILVDRDVNKITDSALVESLDTPNYVDYFVKKGFFKQFSLKPIRDITDKNSHNYIDVDAVSGATFTSEAVKDSINLTLKQFIPVARSLSFDIRKKRLVSPHYTIKKLQ